MNLIKDIVGRGQKYTDHVGIELEVEGKNLPKNIDGWDTEKDGSLRGESYEYVLPVPCKFTEVKAKLSAVADAMADSTIYETGYAGTHVHINVSDLTTTQLFNMLLLYLSMEDLIAKSFGKNREGNLFCLRLSDAGYLASVLYDVATTGNLKLLATDDIRYASVNCNALWKYGSIEFRGWRSDGDFDAVAGWVDFLIKLKQEARKIANPIVLLSMCSETQGAFAELWFPNMSESDKETVIRGVRRIQHIAYEGDWS